MVFLGSLDTVVTAQHKRKLCIKTLQTPVKPVNVHLEITVGTCMKSCIVHNSFLIYQQFSFNERFAGHRFCYVLPSLRLHGSEHDACPAQWCHQSSGQQVFRPVCPMDVIVPLIRARFTEAIDHAPLRAIHKTKVQAIRRYAEALFPARYLIWLLLELGAPRFGFRVLSEHITRQGDAYTARTRLLFPQSIPTRDQLDATWKSLTAPLALSPAVECADPPSSGRC